MPSQTAQAINEFVAAPINNLLVFQAIIALLIILGLGYFVWRLFKYISNDDSPIVKVLREIRDAFNGLKTAQSEKLTQVLVATNEQTSEIKKLGKTFGDHQIATSDTVADLSEKVVSLETTVGANTEGIAELKAAIKSDNEAITEQLKGIRDILSRRDDCVGFKSELEQFEKRLMDKLATQPLNVVGNIHLDTGASDTPPAPEAGNQEAAA